MPFAPALPRDDTRPADLDRLEWRVAGVTLFTLLTGFGAHLAIPLPPDGVPMTLQTLAVVLAAMCLGPKLGITSMLAYLLVGFLGAGWFAGGNAGIEVLFGQTGGYLVGFVLCQPVIFRIIRRRDGTIRGWGAIALASLAGHAVIFAIGVPWLAAVRGFSPARAIEGGFMPFVPGLIVKTVLAVLIARWAIPRAARRLW
ncbi:MAG: biotin transporter BioY [Phycisphaerales bacterium JB037]